MLENVDSSISAHADRATARQGQFQQFTPVWAEVESRITLEGPTRPAGSRCWSSPGSSGRWGIRPVSDLIDTPNWFSFIVALLAGVVGVVSLTEARSSILIGVFISVTTIPAASDAGVSLAFGSDSEAWGLGSAAPPERHGSHGCRGRRAAGVAGHLAEGRPPGCPAGKNRRLMA